MASETSTPIHNDPQVVEDEVPETPISVPDAGESGEGGKLKMIVSLVKKCLGVKDIAAMRLSLPASLLEPIPNLEYWHYLDRPDMFSAINDSEDQFERMLAVLRYAFTKDLKFVHGKVCKPYNSVLGEHFRAHWDVFPLAPPEDDCSSPMPVMYTTDPSSTKFEPTTVSETGSVKSSRSSKSIRSGLSLKPGKSPSTAPTSPQPERTDEITGHMSNLNLSENGETSDGRLRVVYVTEQVSHHPPVSAYFATCPARSLELYGIDQISAKVSGTTVRVLPGQYNQGLYVNITGGHGAGEQYHITHPTASVNGILKGSFYVTVSDSTIITCTGGNHGQQFRAVIEYKEESWFGRPHFLLEGVIHTVHDGETQHEQWTKVKHVPHSRVVAVFDGTWRGQIRWRRVGLGSYPEAFHSAASSPSPSHLSLPTTAKTPKSASKFELSRKDDEYATLIDLSTLQIVPKSVRPVEKQLPHESRKLWSTVTTNLLKKEFGEATKEKMAIEQKQRDHAADRKRKAVEFVPRYFDPDMSKGWAALTAEGKKAVEEELKEDSAFCIEGTEAELFAAGDS